jgi:alkaline phosphatase
MKINKVPGCIAAFSLLILFAGCSSASPPAKNIIIMIADGMCAGSWDAAEYWEHGSAGQQRYSGFPVAFGVSTYPLNTKTDPDYTADELCGYDPISAWEEGVSSSGLPFSGYNYLITGTTDSAAAATAMASGIKTYNSSINYDNFGNRVETILQKAKKAGKATGVITTVEFCHATPAGFAAQNMDRNNYLEIAHQMLTAGDLDLVMGCVHPFYDANGSLRTAPVYDRIPQSDWESLAAGTLRSGSSAQWTLIETKADFESLLTSAGALPIAGIPRIRGSLQQGRSLAVQGADESNPSGIRFVASVPDLSTMSLGALHSLSADPDGMFLMIEGGATDRAAHAHQSGQLIEETADFNHAVASVIGWIETRSSWDETLLIVTSDHGNGLVYGPEAGTVPFQPVKNNGAGVMPGFTFQATGHTNELVKLWAKGAYSFQFFAVTPSADPGFSSHTGHNTDGLYIDNTDIFRVMSTALYAE